MEQSMPSVLGGAVAGGRRRRGGVYLCNLWTDLEGPLASVTSHRSLGKRQGKSQNLTEVLRPCSNSVSPSAVMSEGTADQTLDSGDPEVSDTAPTLTDHLNKRLLESFLHRLNETSEAATVTQTNSVAVGDDFCDS
ncbi:hypothetical protein V5799_013526 [Amblyomma americanum]|uniref:Uncharacterized protein n=1 Tax=Amblyomma americanum TaxID=6943 RepID=A0AAQ4E5M3_AMBAM